MTTVISGATVINQLTGVNAIAPNVLFDAGEQGAWYDPSDLSTMFQDSAGTTPVTAVEQPVGKILDKSGRGNHATQATAGNRPTLSARVNLLTKTEDFADVGSWTNTNLTPTANQTTAPDGTNTADLLTETTTNGIHISANTAVISLTPIVGTNYTSSLYLKKGPGAAAPDYVQLSHAGNGWGSSQYATVNVSTGAIAYQTGGTATSTNVGGGWYRFTWTAPATAAVVGNALVLVMCNNSTAQVRAPSYAGSTDANIYVWGADFRLTNDGVGLPGYQRVDTATSYDTADFPNYLLFNGTSSALATASINFSATSTVTLFTGIRKLSDAATGALTELSASTGSNSGAFAVFAPVTPTATYTLRSVGSVDNLSTYSTYTAPLTNVISGVLKTIAADATSAVTTRINGQNVTRSSGNSGTSTGNFSNYPLYIGARAGTSFWFNGRLYSLIIRGAETTGETISNIETWVNNKTRAY